MRTGEYPQVSFCSGLNIGTQEGHFMRLNG